MITMDILEVRQLIRDKTNKAMVRMLEQEKRCQDLAAFAIKAAEVLSDGDYAVELDFQLNDGSYDLVLCFDWETWGHKWLLPETRKSLVCDFAMEELTLVTTDFYVGWLVIEDHLSSEDLEPRKIHIHFNNVPRLDLHTA